MSLEISHIITALEKLATPSLQEHYDNAGLLTGNAHVVCSGIICTLDVTEAVVEEAFHKGYNLIIAHHPIIFNGLKQLTNHTPVERTIIAAIKHDIAIYAIHTNLDNVLHGVNQQLGNTLGLIDQSILLPKPNTLKKLYSFVPTTHVEQVMQALFTAGAGTIGNYNECSFQTTGTGSFKAQIGAKPFVGKIGEPCKETEIKLETIFPTYLEKQIVQALLTEHPYETVAYDIISLSNPHPAIGAGLLGYLPEAITEQEWLKHIQQTLNLQCIRHTPFTGKKIKKVALCGGAGSFLIQKTVNAAADTYITADIKYHEFFEADNKLLLVDIGHWESEQFTIDLLHDFLRENFPNFAVLKSKIVTNPVQYYC